MEAAPSAIKMLLACLTDPTVATLPLKDVLLQYTLALENECSQAMDIALFIFGLRCFFCWHGASDLLRDADAVKEVQVAWLHQNDHIYGEWMRSTDDSVDRLKWEKWAFQAKMSVLQELVAGAAGPAAPVT